MADDTVELNTSDYRNAPSGIGPQASEWTNKPHRLVYDLCAEVERLRALIAAVRAERSDAASVVMRHPVGCVCGDCSTSRERDRRDPRDLSSDERAR